MIIALLTSIPWAVLLIFFIKNPEKVEKWASIFARFFSFISLKAEKFGIAGEIQADIGNFSKIVRSTTDEEILPYGDVKIKWVDSTTRESFVKDGKIIIRMNQHQNQAKNFLYATLEWVNRGLIPQSRNFIDKTVLRAVDLFFISNFLTTIGKHDVKQLFLDEIYEEEVKQGSLLEKYCIAFNNLERAGSFSGIILPEFSLFGKKIPNALPSKDTKIDSIGFIKMLLSLSKRRRGEDVSPTYIGKYIKCSIVLVAREETYLNRGLDPYLGYINRCIGKGVCSIYVCAIGNPNVQIVQRIRDAYASSKKIKILSENVFPVNRTNGIVIRMVSTQ